MSIAGKSVLKSDFVPPPRDLAANANMNENVYRTFIAVSQNVPHIFWDTQARQLVSWFKNWRKIYKEPSKKHGFRWFLGGKLNASYNCLDRHLEHDGNRCAVIWESDDGEQSRRITYKELHEMVCRFANVLKSKGVEKGDRVCIYMPMIPETLVAMLAVARIGAVHSVVFGGFSAQSLRSRILDCDAKIVITADEGVRGGRKIPLKENTDIALADCPDVETVIIFQRTGADVSYQEGRDFLWASLVEQASPECQAVAMDSEDPLFILYTSGSTGRPKGILHTTGGYLVQVAFTYRYVFDYKPEDIYWCTADMGWITGHSYILYGPLINGATTLMFEGVPNWPTPARVWEVIDKYKVSVFYTAPTAIRQLMAAGDEYLETTSRKSLRILGSVGEPINPEAWNWYHRKVGESRCPVLDTWWQTETGGIMIAPMPGATHLLPGSPTEPLPAIEMAIMDEKGKEIEGEGSGDLVIKTAWPGMLRTIYGDHQRMLDVYYKKYPGYYFTGDGARRDVHGYYFITGRVDDVLNVSGHRLSTAEIESALVLHEAVAEAAVVGYPHQMKGEAVYAFVTLIAGQEPTDALAAELIEFVRTEIGSIAKPDVIQWAPNLPKTRSGKIMRRILRKIAADDLADLGDTSTLADPQVITELVNAKGAKTS